MNLVRGWIFAVWILMNGDWMCAPMEFWKCSSLGTGCTYRIRMIYEVVQRDKLSGEWGFFSALTLTNIHRAAAMTGFIGS